MSIEVLTEMLGWCVILDFGLLMFAALVLKVGGGTIRPLHARLFDVSESALPNMYFQYLANLKIAALALHVVPYFALKLIE